MGLVAIETMTDRVTETTMDRVIEIGTGTAIAEAADSIGPTLRDSGRLTAARTAGPYRTGSANHIEDTDKQSPRRLVGRRVVAATVAPSAARQRNDAMRQ